jgi:UDP-2,3-diacylglucosamine pyrophosphatase LpxH
MPDVRYVCLSDVHFGAENSILTTVDLESEEADLVAVSPALTALLECLRVVVDANEDRRKPELILNGDVLELALTTDEVAATVFGQFAKLAFGGPDPMFADTVYYVPGNHDHHLWEGARERQYRDYIVARPLDQPLEAPWHTTKLFHDTADRPVEAELLSVLMARFTGRSDIVVRAVYPNMGLGTTDGERNVVFHHGHYVESLYRLMSTLKSYAFPTCAEPETVWDWEAENFAWVDFFWSTLGRSGDVGTDVGLVYEMLQSKKALLHLSDTIATSIRRDKRGEAWKRWITSTATRLALHRIVPRVVKLERNQATTPLSDRGRLGLDTYLKGPLRLQLLRERNETLPKDLTFVMGHTHKPFELQMTTAGFPAPVQVLNTGGWVVDSLSTAPLAGGAAILLDESLETVSLRMYNQAATSAGYRVAVHGRPSDFHTRIDGLVQPDKPPWADFSRTVAALVVERQALLAKILARAEAG